jgi:hypothetical protein
MWAARQIRNLVMTCQAVAKALAFPASLGRALGSERFATLLSLLLPLSLKICSGVGTKGRDSATSVRARFDAQNTLTAKHLDGDALLFCPLEDLRCPAHVVPLLHTGDFRRFALTQEFDDGFPIDLIFRICNV